MLKEDFHFTHKIQYTGYTTSNSRSIEYCFVRVTVANCRCQEEIKHPYVYSTFEILSNLNGYPPLKL